MSDLVVRPPLIRRLVWPAVTSAMFATAAVEAAHGAALGFPLLAAFFVVAVVLPWWAFLVVRVAADPDGRLTIGSYWSQRTINASAAESVSLSNGELRFLSREGVMVARSAPGWWTPSTLEKVDALVRQARTAR